MNPDDPLARAISEWQRKHHIADDDPMIAVLELVRLQVQHARVDRDDSAIAPPSFEDFRSTIELLDRRSKALVQQATDLIGEMRRFGNNLRRSSRGKILTNSVLFLAGLLIGVLMVRCLS